MPRVLCVLVFALVACHNDPLPGHLGDPCSATGACADGLTGHEGTCHATGGGPASDATPTDATLAPTDALSDLATAAPSDLPPADGALSDLAPTDLASSDSSSSDAAPI